MDDGDIHALTLQAVSRLQSEKTRTDDDGAAFAFSDFQHLRHVVEIAIGEHAG
ncbi:hypothetical protein D3C72_1960850 [compost metagenome]